MTHVVKFNRNGAVSFTYDRRTLIHPSPDVSGRLNQLLTDKEAEIMYYLSESLKGCFGADFFSKDDPSIGFKRYTDLMSVTEVDNIDYYLVFSTVPSSTRSALVGYDTSFVFTYGVQIVRNEPDKIIELYSVCKSNTPQSGALRQSELLNTIINSYFTMGFTKAWLGVLFSNPVYVRAVTSYLRAGFDIKFVSSLGSHEKMNFAGRYLVMEAYAGKRAFDPATPQPFDISPAELTRLLQIATNIKAVEYDSLTATVFRLDPSAWKLLLKNTIAKTNECGGIIYKHTNPDGTFVIDSFSILMGCEGSSIGDERQCTTEQVYSHEINFHIHTIFCYNKVHGAERLLAAPSLLDYTFIFQQYSDKLKLFHMVVALEGIYVLQVHPYWKFMIDSGRLSAECYSALSNLIGSYINPLKYGSDINDTLKYANNLMSPDFLIKHYISLHGNDAVIQQFKAGCIAQGLNRNINLFICTFVRYPLRNEFERSAVPILDYIAYVKELKTNFAIMSLDQIHTIISSHLENNFLEIPIQIPHFQFTPEYLATL